MTAEPDADDTSDVRLRLILKGHGDFISPVQSPIPATELSEQVLASAQWLARRPGLMIKIRAKVSLDQWQDFCKACSGGSGRSDPAHADLKPLYAGRGGYVIDSDADAESPPAYDSLAEMSPEASQSVRKRQRTGLRPSADAEEDIMEKIMDRIADH